MDDLIENSAKRRRGGIQQRIAKQREDAKQYPSVLAEFLLSQFAWGHFSAQMVQTIAGLAMKDIMKVSDDYEQLDDLIKLSKVGSSGAHANNCHTALMVHAKSGVNLADLFYFNACFKPPHGEQIQAALLPHELFASLFHHYEPAFFSSVLPDVSRVPEFWQAVQHHPQMESHPIKSTVSYTKYAIPLGIHGDGVPVVGLGKGWCKMALVFSWSSLLAKGNTLSNQFYIWSVFERLCITDGENQTLDTFFRILVWSLKYLWLGVWPDEDHNGNKCSN